jgi:hypothetical protein
MISRDIVAALAAGLQDNLLEKLAAQERQGKAMQAGQVAVLTALAAVELAGQAATERLGRGRLARGQHRLYLVHL